MLSAVPDLVPSSAWVQVLGRIFVHDEEAAHRLTGSGQRLLSVLVAAGRDGATAERIAEEIWGDQQPNPWRPALRMAVARLRKQLPTAWDVVSDGGSYRITTDGKGWIDAWRLEEIASARTFIAEDDLAWMLAGPPFGDLDLLEMVTASTQNLQMLQITVAERFCAQAATVLSTATCSALTSLVRDHPYNDGLAVVVAETLARADRRTEALLALTAFADAYVNEFGAVPSAVSQFLASGGQAEPAASSFATPAPTPVADTVTVPKELRHLIEAPLLGRRRELAALRESHGALVTGARGAGKSRLLAALITENSATETTYVVGDDRLDLSLGPFAVAMPGLRDQLLTSVTEETQGAHDDGSADRAASTRAWRIVLAHLEARSANRSQRLVVDDAHLLDPASLGLLRLLIRSNTAADLTFVVCGRSDFDAPEWVDLVRDAERAGLDPIELHGLDIDELEMLVLEQFPNATHQARQGLATDVYEASGGLPAVAAPLIASADPETLALPEQLGGASALTRVTASLGERSLEVVAAAAVLGHQFSIGALISLTELDESSIFRVLDDLWSTGLIVETDDPDQVRFRHVLIQRAFLEGVPLFRRGQLHRRAAELIEDPHQRADHQANASALVPANVAAASLLHSARLYAGRQQWRKVTRELRRIDELPGDHLDSASLTLWAAALDKSGADGSTHRQAAYERAVEAMNWEQALDAALSGLPEAERPDGDQIRIAMLEGIPADELPAERRFDRVFNLSRQYSLLGNPTKTLQHADEALEIAVDPDEVGFSHVLRWMATRHVAPTAHSIPDELVMQGSPQLLVRIAQVNTINLAERGDFDAALLESERFAELAAEVGDPLRMWHAQGFRCMFLLNDGDFRRADELAIENMKFAELHNMQHGATTYVGQRVFSYDCQDRLDELQSELAPFRSNLSRVLLGRAALVLTDHAAREQQGLAVDDLGQEIREIIAAAFDRSTTTFSLLSMILLARFMPAYAPELVPAARSRLERFGDNPILAGFGAGSFGPTVRYVAQLTTDATDRKLLIEDSIDAADRHGPLLWRVRTRLDLAEFGSSAALAEAMELAHGTGLAAVVARRKKGLRDLR